MLSSLRHSALELRTTPCDTTNFGRSVNGVQLSSQERPIEATRRAHSAFTRKALWLLLKRTSNERPVMAG